MAGDIRLAVVNMAKKCRYQAEDIPQADTRNDHAIVQFELGDVCGHSS